MLVHLRWDNGLDSCQYQMLPDVLINCRGQEEVTQVNSCLVDNCLFCRKRKQQRKTTYLLSLEVR